MILTRKQTNRQRGKQTYIYNYLEAQTETYTRHISHIIQSMIGYRHYKTVLLYLHQTAYILRQTDRQIGRQADRQTDTDRQIDRQIYWTVRLEETRHISHIIQSLTVRSLGVQTLHDT